MGEPGGGVRVDDGEPVAGAAGEADEPLGVLGDERGGGRGGQQVALAPLGPGAGMRVGEDPAEVLVPAPALAQKRDVAVVLERDSAPVIGRTPNCLAAWANSSEP
jgi:hypothetical protein